MYAVNRPILRYHGGKFRLAPWIISYFPSHDTYVEPFGGAASVLMQKPRSRAEIYNDLDSDIVNVMRVLRDKKQRKLLEDALILTPYSREEFNNAYLPTDDPIEKARRTFIRAEMGFGSAGATKGITGFRIDTKREYGTAMDLWTCIPDKLASFGKRFAGVLIENRDAIEVMQQHDGDCTLHYVDPPYLFNTRCLNTFAGRCYKHELTDEQHIKLLSVLKNLRGMVILSGYQNDLYNDILTGWTMTQTNARIAAFRGTKLKQECLWLNQNVINNQKQLDLLISSSS